MTTRVTKHINSERDLEAFLRITDKFTKKFYNVKSTTCIYERDDADGFLLFTAIGISRDLIYKIKWEIYTKDGSDTYDPDTDFEHGAEPIDETTLKMLFPEYGVFLDGKKQTVFGLSGFALVDSIEDF